MRCVLSAGQVPSQEDIKVLLYSDAVTQEQLEETLFAAGMLITTYVPEHFYTPLSSKLVKNR